MAEIVISLPVALLERIDEAASTRGISRSELLQLAAEREVRRWPALDAAAVIRADRDAR